MKEHTPQNTDPSANEKALAPEEFALPEALQKQLTDFEKRLCRTETMVAVFGGITALLLAFGLVFLSDRFCRQLHHPVACGYAVGLATEAHV